MQNITKLICAKNKISYVVFDVKYKVLEYNNTALTLVNDSSLLSIGSDIRDSMWEFIGIEESLTKLLQNNIKENIIHFPMILKGDEYYDLDVEIFLSDKGENFFIAYIIQKPKESLNYISMIKEINKKTLIYESKDKKSKEENFNLINQKLLSFNVNMDGIITLVNSAFAHFFDLSDEKIIGKHFSHFFKARDLNLNANATIIFNAKNLKDEVISFHANIIPITENNNVYENIIICQDITYLKQIEKELEYAASHDSLTGLANRSFLLKKIDTAIENSHKLDKSFTICFIDLNKFKPINDNYGHHAGDMLLKHTATLLSNFIRKGDIVSRIGGDEFVILFHNIDEKIHKQIFQRLRDLPVEHPLIYSQEDIINFSFSVGFASYPEDATEVKELLKIADNAMYLDKKAYK